MVASPTILISLPLFISAVGAVLRSHGRPLENGIGKPDGTLMGFIKTQCVATTHVSFTVDVGPVSNLFIHDCQRRKSLMFIHIPKNAGTTVEDVANQSGIKWGKPRAQALHPQGWANQTMPDGNLCSQWHIPPYQLAVPNVFDSYKGAETFCVTRDPWDRMISEYMYEKEKGWGGLFWASPLCSVQQFNTWLSGRFKEIKSGRRWISDCHMLPQWEYIEDSDGKQWCDHVLSMSNLADEFNSLMAQKGFGLRMTPNDKSNEQSLCPVLQEIAHKDKSEIFSEANKRDMRSTYWQDFAHLGDSLA